MSLGKNINRLRSQKNMSQGDLADALGVSRQSISKWETDASVPELDKLIKLSNLFGVSLDELVQGTEASANAASQETPPASEPHAQPEPAQNTRPPTRKIVGAILFCMAFLVFLLFAVLGSFLSGLLFSSPLWLCGIVCFACKRHVGLYCAWAVFFAVDTYLRYATGITFRLTRMTLIFEPSMNYARLATSWCQLIAIIALIAATVLAHRKEPIELTGKKHALFLAGCIAFVLLHIPVKLGYARLYAFLLAALDAARIILLTVILSALARWLHQRRRAAG